MTTGIDAPLRAVLDEIEKTVLERHQKYGPSNVSGSPGGPLNGLRVRLHDKLARINNWVDNGGTADFTDDAFRDAFVDVVGYGLIGLLVVDGKWPTATVRTKPGHPDYVHTDIDYPLVWKWESGPEGTGYRCHGRYGSAPGIGHLTEEALVAYYGSRIKKVNE